MRILSQSEIENLNIPLTKYWDECFFYVGVTTPFDYHWRILSRVADIFSADLLKLSDGDCNTTLKRHTKDKLYNQLRVVRFPIKTVNTFHTDKVSNGAILLEGFIDRRTIQTSVESMVFLDLNCEIREWEKINYAIFDSRQSIDPVPHLPEYFKGILRKTNVYYSSPNTVKKKSSKVKLPNLLITKEEAERSWHNEKIAIETIIDLLVFETCYLLNGRLVNKVKCNEGIKIQILVDPVFQDGLTFNCFKAMSADLEDFHPEYFHTLKTALSKKVRREENNLSIRQAEILKYESTCESFGSLANHEKPTTSDLSKLLLYEPYTYTPSPEVMSWKSDPRATDISLLHLAYSIGGAQWSRAMGVLSMW